MSLRMVLWLFYYYLYGILLVIMTSLFSLYVVHSGVAAQHHARAGSACCIQPESSRGLGWAHSLTTAACQRVALYALEFLSIVAEYSAISTIVLNIICVILCCIYTCTVSSQLLPCLALPGVHLPPPLPSYLLTDTW